jgi:hypothetical protein
LNDPEQSNTTQILGLRPSAVPVVGCEVDVVTARSARTAIGGKEREAFVWGDVWPGDGNLRVDYVGSFRLNIFPVKSAF